MSDETTPEITEFSAAALSDTDLTTEYDRIRARGQELSAKDALSDEESTEFAALAERLPLVDAELTARTARREQEQAQRDAFATLPERSIPVVTPTAVQKSTEAAPVAETPAPVAVPSVGEMAVRSSDPAPTAIRPSNTVTTRAEMSSTAAGLLGLQAGDEFSGDNTVGFALRRNASSFGQKGAPGQSQVIAQYKRTREFTVDTLDGPETMKVLRQARNERRLDGGSLATAFQRSVEKTNSLTAAAGWCAPSQNDYDICASWGENVGILDLPTVTVTRGGINYTSEPTFAQIYANAVAAGGGSNFLTEAQVIADTAKTCSEVPCPTFVNRRLDVLALCIRVSFLQAAGYPEVVDAWENGLREANNQEMNRIIIADMVTQAGGATTWTGGVTAPDSFTSALLSAVSGARVDLLYRHNLPENYTAEVALPIWVMEQIRADLSRRTRENMPMLSVSDAQISALFTARNIRPHFVRGYQDGLITGGALAPTFPGGIATDPFLTALPASTNFLIWPAGAVAVARQDVVTLTNVYDSASLATNEFTSLFAEEGFAPIYPCPGLREYTVAGCVAGTVGAAELTCGGA